MTETTDVTGALRQTCMLAALSFRSFGLTRTDKSTSQRITEDAHAASGTARVVVNRLAGADSLHKQIVGVQTQAKATLDKATMPYGDEPKWRLLPTTNFMPVIKALKKHKDDHDELIERLKELAPEIIEEARQNTQSFSVDVPTVDELVNSYAMEQKFQPIPEGNYRGLPEQVNTALSRALERQLTGVVETAKRDTLERLAAPLSHFIQRMEAYDARMARPADKDDRTGRFNESALTHVQDIVNVLNSFNITNSPEVGELVTQLSIFGGITVKELRKDDGIRSAATEDARKVMARLNDWLTPPVAS